eukprot:scaffold1056_cov564-Prasinococcus_capsulatus_cf.AAC.11
MGYEDTDTLLAANELTMKSVGMERLSGTLTHCQNVNESGPISSSIIDPSTYIELRKLSNRSRRPADITTPTVPVVSRSGTGREAPSAAISSGDLYWLASQMSKIMRPHVHYTKICEDELPLRSRLALLLPTTRSSCKDSSLLKRTVQLLAFPSADRLRSSL